MRQRAWHIVNSPAAHQAACNPVIGGNPEFDKKSSHKWEQMAWREILTARKA
jgi:hypothetical protein